MSTLPSDFPKLAKWPFFLADALLLATAAAIAWSHSGRLVGLPFYVVAGCVALAAILGTIPLLADYARTQDQALDDRQRALEALSRTVAASAEQIGIAATGLNDIVERSQQVLLQGEELSKSLQKKVADAQQQIESAHQDELEELEREVAALRSAEADRLEASVDKIHKLAAELGKLEASASKHLAQSAEAVAKAQALADGAAGRLAQAADESAAKVSAALGRTLAAVQESSRTLLGEEQKRVLETIGGKLDATLAALDAQSSKAATTIEAKIAMLEAVVANLKAAVAEASRLPAVPPVIPAAPAEESAPALEDAPYVDEETEAPYSSTEEVSAEPEVDLTEPPAEEPSSEPGPVEEDEPPEPLAEQAEASAPEAGSLGVAHPKVEAGPAPAAAPAQTKPSLGDPKRAALDAPPSIVELPSAPKKARKQAADEPTLDFGDFDQSAPQEAISTTAISADGATRLIVTAYIGIGNRLYIRGEGPGLSWDKGVALQFVSIGKWRWESAEASAPVHFKLYKNDQAECASLGRLTLEPGHQAEVTANF